MVWRAWIVALLAVVFGVAAAGTGPGLRELLIEKEMASPAARPEMIKARPETEFNLPQIRNGRPVQILADIDDVSEWQSRKRANAPQQRQAQHDYELDDEYTEQPRARPEVRQQRRRGPQQQEPGNGAPTRRDRAGRVIRENALTQRRMRDRENVGRVQQPGQARQPRPQQQQREQPPAQPQAQGQVRRGQTHDANGHARRRRPQKPLARNELAVMEEALRLMNQPARGQQRLRPGAGSGAAAHGQHGFYDLEGPGAAGDGEGVSEAAPQGRPARREPAERRPLKAQREAAQPERRMQGAAEEGAENGTTLFVPMPVWMQLMDLVEDQDEDDLKFNVSAGRPVAEPAAALAAPAEPAKAEEAASAAP